LILAKKKGVLTILNPAPYNEIVPELLPYIDILTPNETEFAALIGKEAILEDEIEQVIADWQKKYATRIVVTRGSKGVTFVEKSQVVTIPSNKVSVVDTTGAGDTFNGILAAALGEEADFYEAVSMANNGASLSVQKLGAQTGMPLKSEIEEFMKQQVDSFT
jgi:ribokinase